MNAHLARLEGVAAFPTLSKRLKDIRLVHDEYEWLDTLHIPSMKAMEVFAAVVWQTA